MLIMFDLPVGKWRGEGMGKMISGGNDRHRIQDEGLTYSHTIVSSQNKVKQAATGDPITATGNFYKMS